MPGATHSGWAARRHGLSAPLTMRATGGWSAACSMPRAAPPMPADSGDQVSRRTVLTGLIALFLAGCERLGFLAANAPAAFGSYTRHTKIAYGPDPQQRLDVYVPESAVGPAGAASPRPVVGFWPGGGGGQGDKADYRFVGAALAQSGYVTLVANYRHYPQVKMPGFMQEAAQAALWGGAHSNKYCGAPERVLL